MRQKYTRGIESKFSRGGRLALTLKKFPQPHPPKADISINSFFLPLSPLLFIQLQYGSCDESAAATSPT